MKVLQVIKWPWKFLVGNEGIKIAICLAFSECLLAQYTNRAVFQLWQLPGDITTRGTYGEWLDSQPSRWLSIQTGKWEHTDPYLHPIQHITTCHVVSPLISEGFLLAVPARQSKGSSFETLLWYTPVQTVYSYADDKPLLEKYPVSMGTSQGQSL